jgi:hypothetical protein
MIGVDTKICASHKIRRSRLAGECLRSASAWLWADGIFFRCTTVRRLHMFFRCTTVRRFHVFFRCTVVRRLHVFRRCMGVAQVRFASKPAPTVDLRDDQNLRSAQNL